MTEFGNLILIIIDFDDFIFLFSPQSVPHHISKHLEVRQKYSTVHCIFNSLLGVWKCDEKRCLLFDILHKTLSQVFDISSHLNLKLRSKWRNKIVKLCAN